MSTTGYSGTPLPKKLGITETSRIFLVDAPADYQHTLGAPASVTFEKRPGASTDIVQVFSTKRGELAKQLTSLRKVLRPDAAVWVSWPKKAAKVPTDITEDTVRKVSLPLGFVDVKVCAVDETWSGLKLVVRKELR